MKFVESLGSNGKGRPHVNVANLLCFTVSLSLPEALILKTCTHTPMASTTGVPTSTVPPFSSLTHLAKVRIGSIVGFGVTVVVERWSLLLRMAFLSGAAQAVDLD